MMPRSHLRSHARVKPHDQAVPGLSHPAFKASRAVEPTAWKVRFLRRLVEPDSARSSRRREVGRTGSGRSVEVSRGQSNPDPVPTPYPRTARAGTNLATTPRDS